MKSFTITLPLAALAAAYSLLGVATAASAAGTPECTNTDLTASYRATDAGMSHRFGTLVLTNTSGSTCYVRGFGGLSYVGGGTGRQVGSAATRMPSTVRTVVLEPGDKARSAVSETTTGPYSAAQCDPTKVDGFRVYVPDSRRSQFIAHTTTTCADTGLDMLAHKAYH